MRVGSNHSVKFQLRPAKLPSRPDIPCPLPESQLRLQNDHILRPANVHGFGHHHEVALIGAVKFPHPPQVPGRKTWNVRVCSAQMLRCGNGGTFFRPAVDQPPQECNPFRHFRPFQQYLGIRALKIPPAQAYPFPVIP